jgi:hypothetical protein
MSWWMLRSASRSLGPVLYQPTTCSRATQKQHDSKQAWCLDKGKYRKCFGLRGMIILVGAQQKKVHTKTGCAVASDFTYSHFSHYHRGVSSLWVGNCHHRQRDTWMQMPKTTNGVEL